MNERLKNYPDNSRARHDARTPCGSRMRMKMQQSRAHSSKGDSSEIQGDAHASQYAITHIGTQADQIRHTES